MVFTSRDSLLGEISPRMKASSPKRTGTRTNSLFLKMVGLPFCSITLLMSSLIAFEPISMAANLRMTK